MLLDADGAAWVADALTRSDEARVKATERARAYRQTEEQRERNRERCAARRKAMSPEERKLWNLRKNYPPHDHHVRTYLSEQRRIAKQARDKERLERRWREMPDEEKTRRYSQDADYRATAHGKNRRFDSTMRRKFGITTTQWWELFGHQEFVCAICGEDEPGGNGIWNTDHCHETKTLRGVLCNGCNSGLGHFKDNPDALWRAIAYLARTPASEIGLAVPGAAPGKK